MADDVFVPGRCPGKPYFLSDCRSGFWPADRPGRIFMNRINYQKEMEKVLQGLPDRRHRLFLHSCCAPCSSYCLEYLRQYFAVTVFYYNPNISMPEEYRRRVEEQKRLIAALNAQREDRTAPEGQAVRVGPDGAGGEADVPALIRFAEGPYEPEVYFEAVKGLEDCPEGGERCFVCYELRLREAAKLAAEGSFDFFTTTLSVSPLKNAEKLNEIGRRAGAAYGVAYLPSDFKKKGGYQRSVALSRMYGLYRQDYCGCVFSRAQRRKQEELNG